MPRYRYQAIDAEGNRQSGEREAPDPDRLRADLAAEGLRVEAIEPGEGDGSRPLSAAEVAEFTRHVAGLSRSGLPLASGLRALGDELDHGPMRRALADLAGRLEAGQSLDEALGASGERFPSHLRGLVLAGVRSGRLAEALEQFARYQDLGRSLRRQVWMSLAYPLMLVGLVLVLFAFISTVVVRGFEPIFRDFGLSLPQITLAVLSVSEVIADAGFWIVTGMLLFLAFGWLLAGGAWGGRPGRAFRSRFPVVGPLRRWTALVGFTNLLALLLESEVPLPAALQLTGEGLRDPDLARACRDLQGRVEAGDSLAGAIEGRSPFPTGLAPVLRWAETHHSLPGALRMAGDLYESRARAQATFLGVACTVLAALFVLGGISTLILGLFLPLIQLISKLSG